MIQSPDSQLLIIEGVSTAALLAIILGFLFTLMGLIAHQLSLIRLDIADQRSNN